LPILPDATGGVLTAVSCVSATACTAVGYDNKPNKGPFPVAFAEGWNGSRWSFLPTPKPAGSAFSAFAGISCIAPTACTAVGYTSQGPLAERWNGTRWSIQSLPYPANAYNAGLSAVSCTSATACTAVGDYYVANKLHYTLAYAWNGTGWSIQATPNPKGAGGGSNVANGSHLESVSCVSVTACTSVGWYDTNAQGEVPFAERWNGTAWSVQHMPTREAVTALDGVSCAATTVCIAVGITEDRQFVVKTFAEVWNGTTWSVQAPPNPGASNGLSGVSCTSATYCVATGTSGARPGVYGDGGTLAEVWHGTAWSVQATPNPGSLQGDINSLSSVSCASPTACTAVGVHATPSVVLPLAERYSG
jgi:hypothetical protein